MASWRDQILSEFTPQVARLTLVADPDGLLLEEGVLEGIRERGFELIPFEDHVAFRYAYESKFRSRWDRGEETDLPAAQGTAQAGLVVVLRSPSSDLDALPYDLLQAGRKLSFNLGDLFPNLSYPVVAALDRADLDALFDAQTEARAGAARRQRHEGVRPSSCVRDRAGTHQAAIGPAPGLAAPPLPRTTNPGHPR